MATAATLDTLVTLRRPVEVRGAAGAVSRAWEDAGELWVDLRPLTGRERLRADQSEASVTHRITARDHPDLGPKWRLTTTDGRAFDLQAVIRPTRARFIELLASEVV